MSPNITKSNYTEPLLACSSACIPHPKTPGATTASDGTASSKPKQTSERFYEVLPTYSQQFTVYPEEPPASFLENGANSVPPFSEDAYPRLASEFPRMDYAQQHSQQPQTYEVESGDGTNFEGQQHQQQQFLTSTGNSLGFVDGFQGSHLMSTHPSSHDMSSNITQMTRNMEETASGEYSYN